MGKRLRDVSLYTLTFFESVFRTIKTKLTLFVWKFLFYTPKGIHGPYYGIFETEGDESG